MIGAPRSTTVTVQASDPSGIESVELRVGGPSPETIEMTPAGNGVYSATVGPVPGTPGVSTMSVSLTARATDGAGNVATRAGSFILQCVPPTAP